MRKITFAIMALAAIALVGCKKDNVINTVPEDPNWVEWTKPYSVGLDATAIVIETGVNVSNYTVDAYAYQKLNKEGTLWAVYNHITHELRIQTPASQINSSLKGLFCGLQAVVTITGLQYIHATTTAGMFVNCASLTSIDFTGFNTEDITNMNQMFNGCRNLQSLDLSGFNTAKVIDLGAMFKDCIALKSLTLSNNFTVAADKKGDMFKNCGKDAPGGCTIYGVTDMNIKSALQTDTGWDDSKMHFAE